MKSFVGNDLIDFAAAHNRGRARQPRFLDRVLTVAERDRMAVGNHGDHGFALLWSAKEAAYKAAKKHDSSLVFAPRRWQVEVDSLASSPVDRNGSVIIAADTRVVVRWRQRHDWLHCVALLGEPPGLLDQGVARSTGPETIEDFREHEFQRSTCRESVAVRSLAKRLLQRRAVRNIEILRAWSGNVRLPPKVCIEATPLAGIDVSLSHDGRFVAAVITVETEVIGPP